MKPFIGIHLLAVIVTATACSGATGNSQQPRNQPPAAAAEKPDSAALTAKITEIAATAKGRVGVDAVVMETGRTVVSLAPDEHFPMQSVCKLPISMAVLAQVDAGKFKLGQSIRVEKSDLVGPNMYSPIRDHNPDGTAMPLRELIRFAVMESDGTASDVLFRLAGGAAGMRSYLDGLGVKEINLINTENELGMDWGNQYKNWATPRAATKLLRALLEQKTLSDGSRALLLKFMTESLPGAGRLKGQLPAGTLVAHKTGTSGSREGITAATNDVGIVTLPNGNHLLIAVFVSDSPGDVATREAVIAQIARAVWDNTASEQ
jgi:beta-lactamase class A